jgi:hypothetical protein
MTHLGFYKKIRKPEISTYPYFLQKDFRKKSTDAPHFYKKNIHLINFISQILILFLVGIFSGMLLKIIIHFINGTPVSSFFKASSQVSFEGNNYLVEIDKAAVFTNYLGIKRKLDAIPPGFNVRIDLENTQLVDHLVMENLHHFEHDYEATGGTVKLIDLEAHIPVSDHHLAARKKK